MYTQSLLNNLGSLYMLRITTRNLINPIGFLLSNISMYIFNQVTYKHKKHNWWYTSRLISQCMVYIDSPLSQEERRQKEKKKHNVDNTNVNSIFMSDLLIVFLFQSPNNHVCHILYPLPSPKAHLTCIKRLPLHKKFSNAFSQTHIILVLKNKKARYIFIKSSYLQSKAVVAMR